MTNARAYDVGVLSRVPGSDEISRQPWSCHVQYVIGWWVSHTTLYLSVYQGYLRSLGDEEKCEG